MFVMLDIRDHFTCGELKYFENAAKFQNIVPKIVEELGPTDLSGFCNSFE